MKASINLRKEKTNVGVKGSTTFNAPGNFIPPYGKTIVQISGRGESGNATIPGTYATTNPPSSNVAGYNPPSGGNLASPSSYNPGALGQAIIGRYMTYTQMVDGVTNPSLPPTYNGYVIIVYDTISSYYPPLPTPYTYYSNTPFGLTYLNYSFVATWTNGTPATYTPAYYNTTTPGTAYYNTVVPGNANYNAPVSGTAGATANINGVTFPGGAADSLAPVVATTNILNSGATISVAVPTGGYVTVTNI